MQFQLPLTIDFGTLPQTGQGYTPQTLADRLGSNALVFSSQEFALFVTGNTAPTSNVGPWLANGNEWRVWDSGTGAYVPITIDQESLGYFIGSTTPDQNVYQFWIQTNGSGQPLALKTYYSGAWTDVYANTLAGYATLAYLSANYYTQAQTDAAITAAVDAQQKYSAAARLTSDQSVAISGAAVKLTFDNEVFDTGSVYNAALSRYVAPVDGIYQVSLGLQVDNDTGDASAMEIGILISVNGGANLVGSGTSVASPPGSRWYPNLSGLVELSQGDYIEAFIIVNDGVLAGLVDVSNNENSRFNINLVEAT